MTIREVAKRAGVSLQTVSNVINGRTSQVGEETRQRVLHWIEELGYQPNAHARSLRSQRTCTVGFLTVDPSDRFLADPFHTAILSGMADLLRENDYCLLVQALDPEYPARSFQKLYRQKRFDGALVHLSGPPAQRKRCALEITEGGAPFVLIEERLPGPRNACVLADNRSGAEAAVAHLHGKGHQRMGFLYCALQSWPAVEERLEGFESALQARRLPAGTRLTMDREGIDPARATLAAALRSGAPLTAVICANDVLAVGALQAAKSVGRRVPDDLAIVGFDDFDFTRFVEPPLTTVALPAYQMGRRGAELLLGYFQRGTFDQTEVVFPTKLTLRGTA